MIGEFYDTIARLKDRNEVRLFFKSLLSADEIATLMRRVEIAVLLYIEGWRLFIICMAMLLVEVAVVFRMKG